MTLHNPLALLLIFFIVGMFWYARKERKESGLRFSSGELLKGLRDSFKAKLYKNLFFLRLCALFLIVLALTRPQSPVKDSKVESEGIDIILALDCSTSMLAEDFILDGKRQNRLDVVKNVVRDFIKSRMNDRIGLVAFASRAYTVAPLTLDHGWLLENLGRVRIGMVEDGTAIGSGIVTSLDRIKDIPAKSKIVILLTDGRNNAGKISPFTAAEAAKALKIKIYTIGAGSKGLVPYPVKDFFGNTVYQPVQIDLDEDLLVKIASGTEAQYFRAASTEGLRDIYKQIDKLEKTVIEEKGYLEYNELFMPLAITALILLFLEIILANTTLRRLP